MKLIVAGFGVLIVLIGLLGLVSPARFRALFERMTSQTRFLAAIILRLGFGALLWIAADALRFPQLMRILAAISIIAAVGILIMGRERLDRLVDWWLARSDGLFRLSTFFAAAFGGFLIYVAV
ncbi:MAG: hypothetical protein GY949_00470 [Gammaproteobacteria bacterium]|nr:hypothetical protein [Gammaproteobacteria bacterium]